MSKQIRMNIYRICTILFAVFAGYMANTAKIQAEEIVDEEAFAYNYLEETDSYEIVSVLKEKEELIVPDTYQGKAVTGISDNVFGDSIQAKKIVLGSNIKNIDNYGFYQTTAKEVILPEGLVSIGESAFSEAALESVSVPATVTKIGKYAFASCKSLTGASISGSCKEISEGSFQSCSNLTKVTLQEGLITIGESAFQGCKSLKSIKIPNGTKNIGNIAFAGCDKLYQIEIPESVNKIGTAASKKIFRGCNFQILTVVTPEGSVAHEYAKEEYMDNYQRGILTSSTTEERIDAKSSNMYVGEIRNLNIYNYAGTTLSMKSSNNNIVSVSSYGILKAKKTGKAKITLQLDDTTYTYTFQVLKRTKDNVCKVIRQVYVRSDMSDYEKVVAANEWMARNIAFDKRYYQGLQYLPYASYTVKGTLENGLAVSEGYAYTFIEIMDMYGISCRKINGYLKKDSGQQVHSWNLVSIGGKWYHIDCCLNDPVKIRNNGTIDDTNKKADSTYLLKKDSFMKKNHTWNKMSHPKAVSDTVNKTATTIKGTKGAYLNKTSAVVSVGGSTVFKVARTNNKVTWKSSNKAIATVNAKGKVTGKGDGNAKITVSVAGKKYVCKVFVKNT